MSSVRIGIIGAGVSGLTAAKTCLQQGFDVMVFEKTNCTGGLWRYREVIGGNASIMKSTTLNTSKEMSAFSDFPPPHEFPNYMHNTKMAEYLDSYGDRFGFENYVKLNHEIIICETNDDYEETGKWKLTIKDLNRGHTFSEVFDGVMVCIGHNNKPLVPTFKDQHIFKGSVIHAHSYKKADSFEDKTIVVVGIGNTAGDIVVELSTVVKQAYLSTRSGTWVTRRVGMKGRPTDTQFLKRSWNTLFRLTPNPILNYFAACFMNTRFDHEKYELRPKHGVFSQHVMVNDDLPNRILSGSVIVKGNIDRFTENGVIFEGENEEILCDTVLLATGYQFSYPFLSQSLLTIRKNNFNLYKHMFSPHLKHPKTLAILSLVQPVGAVPPIAELQSRWFALLMANKLKLPDSEKMLKDINRRKLRVEKRYYDGERHIIQVDWIPFVDELANIIGVKPHLWKYFFTDPKLWNALYFGPCLPYQFRLNGPNPWPKARETILTVNERIYAPLKTKTVIKNKSKDLKKSSFVNHDSHCDNNFSEIDLNEKIENQNSFISDSNGIKV